MAASRLRADTPVPTREDFLSAAEMFHEAADQVGGLMASIGDVDVSQIVRGGHLGQFVPDQLAASSHAAVTCLQLVAEAEDLCWYRAAVIADYEIELERYDAAVVAHQLAIGQWSNEYLDWWDDLGRHPGPAPSPPSVPLAPPAWAEVRRA